MPDEPSDGPVAFRRKQAAQALAISERTLDRLISSGELKAIRVRNCVLILAVEVRRYLLTKIDTPNAQGMTPGANS